VGIGAASSSDRAFRTFFSSSRKLLGATRSKIEARTTSSAPSFGRKSGQTYRLPDTEALSDLNDNGSPAHSERGRLDRLIQLKWDVASASTLAIWIRLEPSFVVLLSEFDLSFMNWTNFCFL
jgi:hypothetical protein